MKNFFFSIFLSLSASVFGQDSTAATVHFSGYVETFFALDFNRPMANHRPAFLYSHNRHQEFNVNLAFLKAAYSASNIRANLALATGTYIADNYAAEPPVLKNMLEANVGLKLGAKTWLDAGVLPSHIGFESAISKDCRTLTRSLAAENSPYFETGARLTFSPNENWTLAALALNGWQRIARVNASPAFGSQILWKPTERATLNWSTFFGNERPDTARQWRVFNNFYGIFQLSTKIELTTGFDIGAEESLAGGKDVWLSPVAIVRMQVNEKWAVAARLENFTDRAGVLIAPDFLVSGGSANLDFLPADNALARFELRYLHSENALFFGKNGLKNSTFYANASLAVSF